jgi:hypothetical protein
MHIIWIKEYISHFSGKDKIEVIKNYHSTRNSGIANEDDVKLRVFLQHKAAIETLLQSITSGEIVDIPLQQLVRNWSKHVHRN